MISTKIPYGFLRERTSLRWSDVAYGLEHQLIEPKVAIEKAEDSLCSASEPMKEELELAGLGGEESVGELVGRLAGAEQSSALEMTKAKWLYLVLAWVFENRVALVDPLKIVEEIYCDFDYPPEIASFVRYMPVQGPDLENVEQNEARMFEFWKQYLDNAATRFLNG